MFCSWTTLFLPCMKQTSCVSVALAVHNDFLLSVTIIEERFVCEWARLFMCPTIPLKTYHKMFLWLCIWCLLSAFVIIWFFISVTLNFLPTITHNVSLYWRAIRLHRAIAKAQTWKWYWKSLFSVCTGIEFIKFWWAPNLNLCVFYLLF